MNNTQRQEIAFVLPFAAKIDESLAAFLAAPFLGKNKEIKYFFCRTNKPDYNFRQKVESIVDNGEIVLIDVYPNKYHGKAASASQMIVDQFPILRNDQTVQRLVEMINQNNQTGYLKNFKHSIASILRKIYYLHCESSWSDSATENVLKRTFKVFRAYFLKPQRLWSELFTPQFAELKMLWESLSVKPSKVKDLTIGLYFKQMFEGGKSSDEISNEIEWWLDNYNFIQEEIVKANLIRFEPKEFALPNNLTGIAAIVNNQFEAEVFASTVSKTNNYALRVIRNSKGGIFISSNSNSQVDFRTLYRTLNNIEPGRWYLENRRKNQMLLNKTIQYYGTKSTKLSDEALFQLIYKHTLINP